DRMDCEGDSSAEWRTTSAGGSARGAGAAEAGAPAMVAARTAAASGASRLRARDGVMERDHAIRRVISPLLWVRCRPGGERAAERWGGLRRRARRAECPGARGW